MGFFDGNISRCSTDTHLIFSDINQMINENVADQEKSLELENPGMHEELNEI